MSIPEKLLNRTISVEGEELTHLRAQVMEWLSKLSNGIDYGNPEHNFIHEVAEEMREVLK